MRRYGGLGDKDLFDTRRWTGIESASRYAQTVVREAACKADVLPTPNQPSRRNTRKISGQGRNAPNQSAKISHPTDYRPIRSPRSGVLGLR
jgi:hypothetical protein